MSTSTWRDLKRQIIVIRSILSSKDISGDDRKKMERNIEDLQALLETSFPDPSVFMDEIQSRRDFLSKNFGLLDIFNTLWFIIHSHANEDGTLTKDGYFKIMYSIFVALCGFRSFDDIRTTLELDYYIDHKIFGPMTKLAFFDILFEVIETNIILETWSEILHKSFLAAFSWALLDSMVDMNASLPRLKYIRDVRCILQPMNEGEMIAKFNLNKKIKGSLSIGAEWMDRIPEVQRLLRSKKIVQAFAEKISNMIDLRQNRSHAQLQVLFEDSDHEPQSQGKIDLYLMQAGKERRVVTDGDEDDKSGGSNENNDDSSFNGSVGSQQLTNSRSHKLNTMSFMEYLKGRRHARYQLNGDLPSIPSQSRSGVLSINSLEFDSLPGTASALPQQSLLGSSQSHSLQSHLLSKSALFSDSQYVDPQAAATAMASSAYTTVSLDIVGKNMLGKTIGTSSVGGRKTELPMKNVVLDMAAIAHYSKPMKNPLKQKNDAVNYALRNGFNADLGLVVRPLNLPVDPPVASQSSYHMQEVSMQRSIAPASVASTALAELTRNRKNILISMPGIQDSDQSMAGQSFVSGPNDNDASILSLVAKTPERIAVASGKRSSISGRSQSPILTMSDELINSPKDLEDSFNLELADTADNIELDSRSMRTDVTGDVQENLTSDFAAEESSMIEAVSIKAVHETKFEQPVSPPKLDSAENSRHILGPFPSAYFLSSGNSCHSVTGAAANSRVPGALPTAHVAGFSHHSSWAPADMKPLQRVESSNKLKDTSKGSASSAAATAESPPKQVPQEKAQPDYIITAYPLSTNSRGIFKGLASSSTSSDRESNSWHRADKLSSAAVMIGLQGKQQDRFPNTQSSSSLPNAPINKFSRSSEGSQSIPSLLIRPVTAIPRASAAISLRKDRIIDQDRAAATEFKSDGENPVAAGVINDSVKSLTMLSNSQFEHFKNSIEVSVGGGHLPTYIGSASVSPTKRAPPQLSLQQVSPSPVRYECHQSFLSITGSKDSNFTSSSGMHKSMHGRSVTGNNTSLIFSNAANNALNAVIHDSATSGKVGGAIRSAAVVASNNETVDATPFHLKQEFPHAPWVPQELLIPLDHNRSNRILGWREKLESLKSIPHIPARVTMTIKSQDAVRVSFEEFVKRKNGRYK